MQTDDIALRINQVPWWCRRRVRAVRKRIVAIHDNNWRLAAYLSGRCCSDLMYKSRLINGQLVLEQSFLTSDQLKKYFQQRYSY